MRNDPKTIALYIDCENISYKRLDQIIEQLSSYGEIIIRRAYGNWQKEVLKGWSRELQNHAVRRIHHDEYVTGKNASDIDMTIEITETLLTKNIDIFALATSDSDFTPLVTKLREHGKTVLCFGENKASQSFKKVCSDFICFDLQIQQKTRKELRQDTRLVNMLRNAVNEEKNENAQASFFSVEANLKRNGFSATTFGYEKLSNLLKEIDIFEIDVKQGLHKAVLWDKRVRNHG
ncbi:MAG: NYN domain-containing protein [Sulfuricurvum sp.]|uniref:NYN domain-containing protein n=1 Tax=Sulfuricurvum sp. TaxID=2025608 RepID=UPI00262FF94D|nr:NYN domain-containing protein [Sulfuricurvum sp.]MDD5160495.1 NYN domain-containing protein [Sulfuricurvum sp.]